VGSLRSKSIAPTSWRLLLALLCIVLVVACGTIQVVHTHPQGDVSHSDCALCATAHVVVQISALSVTMHVTPVASTVETIVPLIRSEIFYTFALFTRPPPADAYLS
jgi:hypothetical protein